MSTDLVAAGDCDLLRSRDTLDPLDRSQHVEDELTHRVDSLRSKVGLLCEP